VSAKILLIEYKSDNQFLKYFDGVQKYLFLPQNCELINTKKIKDEKYTDYRVCGTNWFGTDHAFEKALWK
jgi:hypothetical protein